MEGAALTDRLGDRLDLAGITPVLVTPFVADEVDHDALAREAEWLVELGCRAVAIGLASEVTRLSERERIALATTVRSAVPADARLVVACGADSTRALIALASQLADAGADALMVTAPKVPGVTERAVAEHFMALSREVDSSIIVQDAPQETGVSIGDAALRDIVAEVERVVAVKLESADALDRMSRLAPVLRESGVAMLGGSGGVDYLTELELGAGGTLPGPALADVFIGIHTRYRAGDPGGARELMRQFDAPIGIGRRGMQPFMVAQKAMLAARGLPISRDLRIPAPAIPDWLESEISLVTASVPSRLSAAGLVFQEGN